MSFWNKLFRIQRKKSQAEKKNTENPIPSVETEKKLEYDFSTPGLSQWVTFGRNRDGEAAAVVLNRPEDNLHKVIVNHSGCFENFPGIIQGKWTNCIKGKFDFDAGNICFKTSFESRECGGWRCLWEIQPDGRYWADSDGSGMEDDSEIILFADLDENGNFITPFRIYKINGMNVNDDPSLTDMEIDAECVLKKYTGSDEMVIVPEGIKKIGTWAFNGNKIVKEIQLPNTLTEIENGAFERSSLERISIPAGVSKMGYSVFYDCESLTSVTLPDELDEIGSGTFGFCKSLKQIILPHNLKTVNREAFENAGIEEISLPEGMISAGKDSFKRMHNLRVLHLPSSLKYIGEKAFSFCEKLEEVFLPEGLLQIRHGAFDACSRLEKVNLPNSLIELAPTAFSRTPFAKTEDVEALASKINRSKDCPLPSGYKEMSFNGFKLQYSSEEIDFDYMRSGGKKQFEKVKLEYIQDISDNVSVFKSDKGQKAIMLYQSVPTFDSGDREWDSYRKLYLIPTENGVEGFMAAGGYKIAKIYYYQDIRWGNEKTKKMMEQTGVF